MLGISVESNRAHTAYAQQLDVPFPLLSDLNREVVRDYGIMYTPDNRHREGFYGLSKRAVFVLDRARIVRYAWVTDDSLLMPDIEEVLRATAQAGGA